MMIVTCLAVSCASPPSYETRESQAKPSDTRDSLRQIRRSEIVLTDVRPSDAINFIFEDMTFSLDNQVTTNAPGRLVSFRGKDMTLYEQLNEVCRQASLEWMLDGQRIIVRNQKR